MSVPIRALQPHKGSSETVGEDQRNVLIRSRPENHHDSTTNPRTSTDLARTGLVLILEAWDHYAREHHLTEGQELRAYRFLESIAQLHRTVSLGAVQRLNLEHFEQYARCE